MFLDPGEFGVWEKVFSLVGTVAASVIAAVSYVAKRWSSMEDKIDAHHDRLTVIEENYVSKDVLRNVFDDLQNDMNTGFHDLQRDVNAGFTRAHARIDQIYTQIHGARK